MHSKLFWNIELIQISMLLLGYLMNNDVPMYIANCCGEKFFVGCLDEVRMALSSPFQHLIILYLKWRLLTSIKR